MQLELTDSEANALLLAIDTYYSELHEEIYHTDDSDARQSLKDVVRALEQVREQLEPGWMAHSGAGQEMVALEPGPAEETASARAARPPAT